MINGKSGGARVAEPAARSSRDFLADYIWQQQFGQPPVSVPAQVELAALHWEALLWRLGGSVQYAPTPGGFAGPVLDDEALAATLSEAIEWYPATVFAEIEVSVQDHVVALWGRAPHRDAKRVAEALAWSLPGVRDVENRIELRRRIR
jgi:hypothetical protein